MGIQRQELWKNRRYIRIHKNAVLTIDNNGKLVGDINHQSQHTLTNVELYALRNAEIKINIETEIPIYFLPNIELLRVTGDKKAL